MKRPPTLAPFTTSNSSSGVTTPAWSAAVVVTILNTEPGGRGTLNAEPASARTAPLRASSTAIPPARPANAETAASWRSGSMVVRSACPGRGSDLASTRSPSGPEATSSPPGLPASRELKAFSRPLTPTGVPGGKPWRPSSASAAGSAGPITPVTSIEESPSG
jgi:hypothetical protein